MRWSVDSPLRVRDEVEEHTDFVFATSKKSRDGSEMLLAEAQKGVWTSRGLVVVDRR